MPAMKNTTVVVITAIPAAAPVVRASTPRVGDRRELLVSHSEA